MPTFENPSHRRRLTELGILSPDESYVAPADLAHRMVASPYFEEVLYILKQDFAHPVTTLGMIESQSSMPIQTQALLEEMDIFVEVVQQQLALGFGMTPLSSEGERYLREISSFAKTLLLLLGDKEHLFAVGVAQISQTLAEKRQLFQTDDS